MNKENFERLVHDTGIPLEPEEIATDANLDKAMLINRATSEMDERDPYTMTADKLAEKLPGMGIAALQLPDITYAWKHREEDEEILKAEQAAHRE